MKFHKDWYSQAGQDKWVAEYFNSKQNGYFVDIGAGDGIGDSNTYYLEKTLNWNGLCIDPSHTDYPTCKKHRSVTCVNCAVYSSECILYFKSLVTHTKYEVGTLPVQAFTLAQLFEKYKVPDVIDYVSLDIEGAELEALKGWPWGTHIGILWTIEHNLYLHNDATLKNNVYDYLSAKDYVRIVDNVSCNDSHGGAYEDWYVHKNYIK